MTNSCEDRGINKACLVLGIAFLLAIDGVECNPRGRRGPVGGRRGPVGGGVTVFDVMKYGAKANGRNDDGMAIIRAWNAACKSIGPAKLLIPRGEYKAGEVIFAGPCTARRPITIEIQGNLLADTDPSAYTTGAWIMVERVDGLIITGGGTINGRGASVWKYGKKNSDSPLTVSMIFQTVQNSQINNINFVDAMGFHLKVTDSSNIAMSNLKITAPGKSPNTDGIHMSNTTNANITDSTIGTGDDCVSIGHGNQNILVARVTCGPGHGISVGSLGKRPNEMDLKGVTVINCTIVGTTNGARIKTYHGSPSIQASGIVFQDIVMERVMYPIIIDQHYDSKKRREQSKVRISDVHFRNIRGSTVSPVPIILNCSSLVPCEGVELANINLVPFGPLGPLKSACSSAKFFQRGKINPPFPAACS